MNCLKFQDLLSDYVEGELDSRARAECAGHRLICRECRELHADVRAAMQTLSNFAADDFGKPDELDLRIIAATTAGEMLSCNEFDRLIERYFDGVLLAPTFHTFQAHFEKCAKCRRLMSGIEEAIEICKEIKDAEIDAPASLQDRILAATLGDRKTPWPLRVKKSLLGFSVNVARSMWTPEMAAAMLIFAASGLLVLSRFGGVSQMASHATNQAEQLVNQSQRALNSISFQFAAPVNQSKEAQPAKAQPAGTQPESSPEAKSQASDDAGKKQVQPDSRNTRRLRKE